MWNHRIVSVLSLLVAISFPAASFSASSNGWFFEEAVILSVTLDGLDKVFVVEANNAEVEIRCTPTVSPSAACKILGVGLIATFQGTFPAIDQDNQELILEGVTLTP